MGLSWEGWVTIGVLVALLISLVMNLAPVDFSMALALALLMSTQVVTVNEGLQGFSNSSVLTVAVLYIVAAGMNATGALDYYFGKALGFPKTVSQAHLRLLLPVGFVSAFLNNTPVVAMLIPVIQRWARRIRQPVSQLFIPLSFASILGGTCTLIGTSTNLVVAGKYEEKYPGSKIGIFELSKVGVSVFFSGAAYILLFAPSLLPGAKELEKRARGGSNATQQDADNLPLLDSGGNSFHQIGDKDFTVACQVSEHSLAVNKSVAQAGLRGLDDLFLTAVQRNGVSYPAVGPEFVICAGDILFFTGLVDTFDSFCLRHGFKLLAMNDDGDYGDYEDSRHVPDLDSILEEREQDELGIELQSIESINVESQPTLASKLGWGSLSPTNPASSPSSTMRRRERAVTFRDRVVRVVIRQGSFLDGKTPKEAKFRSRYDAAILSLSRPGFEQEVVHSNIGRIQLHVGDVLLLLTGDSFEWSQQFVMQDLRRLPETQYWNTNNNNHIQSNNTLASDHLVNTARTPFEREFLIPMKVSSESQLLGAKPLSGLTVEAAGLRGLPGVFLIAIEHRDGPVEHVVGPDAVLHAGDVLWFAGEREGLSTLRRVPGLEATDKQSQKLNVKRVERRLVECVVSMRSDLIGKTVRETRFRTRFEAAIIAVHRHGKRVLSKIGDIQIQPGDVLVLETGKGFVDRYKNDSNFLLVAEIADSEPAHFDKFAITAVSAIAMIAIAIVAADYIDLLQTAVYAAAVMIATRCITAVSARDSISWEVIVTVACAFGLSRALENTGIATAIGQALVHLAELSHTGFFGVLVAVYFATFAISLIVANNAAALLMFPIAVLAAEKSTPPGEDEQEYILQTVFVLMLAASSSFGTPYGYQTNMMVLNCGNYVFMDFVRFGMPMQIWQLVFSVVAVYYMEYWYISLAAYFALFLLVTVLRLNLSHSCFNVRNITRQTPEP